MRNNRSRGHHEGARLALVVLVSAISMGGWLGSAAAAPPPKAAIAAFQALGVEKILPSLLGQLRKAYEQHTGQKALNPIAVQTHLGALGLKKLGACAQKIPCLINTTRQSLSKELTHAIYVGVGGIGQKLLVRYIVLDLKKGKALHQVNQSYAGMTAFKAAVTKQIKAFFPHFASLRIKGSPAGATVFLNDTPQGKLPTAIIKASTKQPIALRILAEGHKVYETQLQLKPGKLMELTVKLKKLKVVAIRKRPPVQRRPEPPKITPITQKGWFWAVIGVGAAAVAGGVVAGVLLSQRPPCDGCIDTSPRLGAANAN